MIRPLRWKDGHRFLMAARAGLYLDERAARVSRFRPMEAATVALFFPDLSPVLTLADGPGHRFLQVAWPPREGEARLLFMAPTPAAVDAEAFRPWAEIIEAMAGWAAAQGITRLVAEVAAEDLRPVLLRQMGFRRVRRYTVWSGPAEVVAEAFRHVGRGQERPRASAWALHRGARGAWIEEIRNAAGSPLGDLAHTLADLGPRWRQPVYVLTRWEHPEIREALRALGLQPAFTVWRMVRWVALPALWAGEEVEAALPARPALEFPRIAQGCSRAYPSV